MAQSGFNLQIEISVDRTKVTEEQLQKAIERALEKCGMNMERYAKQMCPVDTGNLRNSIVHQLGWGERAVYVGTNVYYAPYVEMGTSKHPTPQPFIEPSVVGHKDEHMKTIKETLENVDGLSVSFG